MKLITLSLSTAFVLAGCGINAANSQVASDGQVSQETVVTCQSADPTFSPYYKVSVRTFDSTFPDSYTIEISATESGDPGPLVHVRESHGSELINGAGLLTFEDGSLKIEDRGNGELAGALNFNFEEAELVCIPEVGIQPVAGVSN